jgi:N-acetylglucosaminyl-diphospho-decaprenol L-rhamnosyltransferase
MSELFIGVVSHQHEKLIKSMGTLPRLAQHYHVVLKSNVDEPMLEYCIDHGVNYIPSSVVMGFGENNNAIYECCREKLSMGDNDIFVILNPDVDIALEALQSLVEEMNRRKVDFAAINLFKNYEMTEYDFSVRNFPSFFTFVSSYFGLGNRTIIDKHKITQPTFVDWAAGSFLAIRAGLYKKVSGFDPKYFMYCEDIDLCYRTKLAGYGLMYFPSIKAVHLAKHANRKLFSKHFIWHVKSAFRFLMSR